MWSKVISAVAWLDGKKTYIVAGLSTLDGVVQLINGGHWSQVLPYIFAGAFGAALRSAVKKVEAQLPKPVQAVVDPVVNDVVGAQPANQVDSAK